jgi:hypothetical protein
VFLLDRMLTGTIRFVLDKVTAAAAAEMDNEEGLRDRLLEAQMRQELGEIDEAEFAVIERDVLAALREIKLRREGGGEAAIPDGMSVVGASAEMSGEFHDHGVEEVVETPAARSPRVRRTRRKTAKKGSIRLPSRRR